MPLQSPQIPIAIVSNGMTPYRLHLHRRVARELSGLKLFSVLTHEDATGQWDLDDAGEIGLTHFGLGEPSSLQPKPGRAPHEFKKGGRVIRFLRQQGVRAVVLIGYNDAGRFRIIRWCRRHSVPCLVFGDSNIRGDRATGVRAVLKRRVLGWLTRNAAGILCCGSLGREFFEKYGAPPEQISYFPYEPDYGLIEQLTPAQIESARAKLKLAQGRRRLAFSGRLVEVKRPDLLIDAFNEIAPQRPQWDLVIVGDGPLRDALKQRVQPELAARVVWTGYQSNAEDIAAIYRCCDALALPSDYEPWAVVVNEACAAGLALVCSDVVGAAAELLRDGVNGRIFRAGDLNRLREALLDVTDDRHIDRMRAQSPVMLREWRRRADPVQGLEKALKRVGVVCDAPNGM